MTEYRFELDSQHHITLSDQHSQEDEAVVHEGLSAFNHAVVGSEHYQPFNLYIRDENGAIMGGLLGVTYWGWCYVSIVWVHDLLRGKGCGRRLLQIAEEEAIRRGCRGMHLDTMSFQALPFYQKLGFTVYGQIDDFVDGHTRFYLQKRL